MTKSIKMINALDAEKMNIFIERCDKRTISKIQHDIYTLLWYWMGPPNLERIYGIENDHPYLKEFIDFKIIIKRVAVFNKLEQSKKTEIEKLIGIHVSEFFPELVVIRDLFTNTFLQLPNGVEKAELWLYPIALHSGANADIEAAIYFASKGEYLLETLELKVEWHRVICYGIEIGRPIGPIPDELIKRARSKTISLSEASEIYKINSRLLRFFAYRDEEEDFIDASFIRAVEWFDVKGFDPWVESFSREMSTVAQDGIDHIRSSWHLFFWCRSNLAIQKTVKIGLESYLWGLVNGPYEADKPWRTIWQSEKTLDKVDYIPTASIIIFAWKRICPSNLDSAVLNRAILLLFQTQLNSGGWPLTSNDSKGSIVSTCFAIHALAIARPGGWKESVRIAKEWLLTQQDEGGSWTIQGGPTVMLTVLCLDSIRLVDGNNNVTFQHREQKSSSASNPKNSMELEDQQFDYSNEDWYKKSMPNIIPISKEEVSTYFSPQIALVAAVEIELVAVLKKLKPPKGKRKVWKVFDGGETYYLGRFGAFDSVVMLSGMGSQGSSGSTLAIDSLIRLWNPTGIVLVGIAFGADRKKHKAGDVIIAENIIPYEQQRVGEEELIFRSPIPPSSFELINRIRNMLDWEFLRPDKVKVSKYIGSVLSGEKLVDNIDFKEKLLNQFPQAIGGEMEGGGLWSASNRHKKSWILVKSVCDWGDGKKHKEFQQLAAASAVSLCEHVFSDKHTLDGMK